jgi:hypothetical protein
MPTHRDPATPSSSSGGDGVRVSEHHGGRRSAWVYRALTVVLAFAGLGYLLTMAGRREADDAVVPAQAQMVAMTSSSNADGRNGEQQIPPASARQGAAAPVSAPVNRGEDIHLDLADYIDPSKPVPSTAEIIRKLNEAGIHSGIGAFNPPGTSPPLVGLAVPEDIALPEGYVRHYQTTDDGQDIEPILMYSPDYEFFDAAGRPIAIPEDRVVPPGMAPAGIPGRRITIPPPQGDGRP